MADSSGSPTMPRVRSDSTRCSETTSERRNSASLSTAVAPCSAARSEVRLGLQASTSMPKADPIRAIRAPVCPSPTSPRVRPSSSEPTVGCHPPSRIDPTRPGRSRTVAKISAQASSTTGEPPPVVPDTTTPRSAHVARSIAALRAPVVTSSRSAGSRASRLRGNRGALPHRDDDVERLQKLDQLVLVVDVPVDHGELTAVVTGVQSAAASAAPSRSSRTQMRTRARIADDGPVSLRASAPRPAGR